MAGDLSSRKVQQTQSLLRKDLGSRVRVKGSGLGRVSDAHLKLRTILLREQKLKERD